MEYTGPIKDQRILDLIEKSLQLANTCGYTTDNYQNKLTFGWGTKVSNTFGCCKWPVTEEDNFFILLNPMVVDAPDIEIENLILHELAHYFCDGDAINEGIATFDYDNYWWTVRKSENRSLHHGKKWQLIANQFGNRLGMPITRTDSIHFQGMRDEVAKRKRYNFRCKNCGIEFGYEKRTKFVDTYNQMGSNGKPSWGCGRCHYGNHVGDEPPFEMIK